MHLRIFVSSGYKIFKLEVLVKVKAKGRLRLGAK